MRKNNRARLDMSSISTLLCGISLTAMTVVYAPLAMTVIALLLLALLAFSQYQLQKTVRTTLTRSDCFYRLAKRLVRMKRNRQRDTKLAGSVLDHIVNQSDIASNTQIWQQPVGDFSGDIAITCESHCGKTYVLLADLTGHGIAAAIGATPVATIFQATAYRGLPIHEIIAEINDKLKRLLPFGYFCCAAVAVCDKNTLRVCNAGLPDLVVCDESGEVVDRVASTLLPLGIEEMDADDIDVFTKHYAQPHQLYAFTDGLIETRSNNDDTFDSETVEAIIASQSYAADRLHQVVQQFESFSKGIQPHDDISIVEVKIC